MKKIRFTESWFETDQTGTSRARFEAGKDYLPDDEAKRCVARGIAKEGDVADEPAADLEADSSAAQVDQAAAEAAAPAPAPAAPAAKAKK